MLRKLRLRPKKWFSYKKKMCSEEGSVSWQGEYVTRTSYDREDTTNEHEF